MPTLRRLWRERVNTCFIFKTDSLAPVSQSFERQYAQHRARRPAGSAGPCAEIARDIHARAPRARGARSLGRIQQKRFASTIMLSPEATARQLVSDRRAKALQNINQAFDTAQQQMSDACIFLHTQMYTRQLLRRSLTRDSNGAARQVRARHSPAPRARHSPAPRTHKCSPVHRAWCARGRSRGHGAARGCSRVHPTWSGPLVAKADTGT